MVLLRDDPRRLQILEVTLGPDAGDVQMQIGLNSGAITAAVLRREKGRLQLFGNTVDTAAWREANCVWNPIYVTQSMADCLITGSKGHYIKARNDIIEPRANSHATYWVEPSSSQENNINKKTMTSNRTANATNTATSTTTMIAIGQASMRLIKK